jgi:hypothetical protein
MQDDKKPLTPLIKFAKLKDIKAAISLPAYYSLISSQNSNTRVVLPLDFPQTIMNIAMRIMTIPSHIMRNIRH